MATNLIAIVPDGDTLIILPTIKASDADTATALEVVEEGVLVADNDKDWADVEIITNEEHIAREEVNIVAEDSIRAAKKLRLSNDNDAKSETSVAQAAAGEILHFKVSMRHLVSASPRAKMVLQGPFKESTPHESDGLLHWTLEPLFDPIAFEIVMRIIHAQNDKVPKETTLDLLTKIAVIVDDLQCRTSAGFFATWWVEKLALQPPPTICENLARIIFISSVFGLSKLFETSTMYAMLSSTEKMPDFGLPISADILDSIEEKRNDLLKRRLKRLYSIFEFYNDPELCFTCRAGNIGLLYVNMHEKNIPMPTSSLSEVKGLSLRDLEKKVKSFTYPPEEFRRLCGTGQMRPWKHPNLRDEIEHYLKHFRSNTGKLKLR